LPFSQNSVKPRRLGLGVDPRAFRINSAIFLQLSLPASDTVQLVPSETDREQFDTISKGTCDVRRNLELSAFYFTKALGLNIDLCKFFGFYPSYEFGKSLRVAEVSGQQRTVGFNSIPLPFFD